MFWIFNFLLLFVVNVFRSAEMVVVVNFYCLKIDVDFFRFENVNEITF